MDNNKQKSSRVTRPPLTPSKKQKQNKTKNNKPPAKICQIVDFDIPEAYRIKNKERKNKTKQTNKQTNKEKNKKKKQN